jgi:hypothetical protein
MHPLCFRPLPVHVALVSVKVIFVVERATRTIGSTFASWNIAMESVTPVHATHVNVKVILAFEGATRTIGSERQRQRNALLQDIKKNWDRKQAVISIERQLAGMKFSEDVKTKLESAERTPEHNRLIETIMTLTLHHLFHWPVP